MQQSHCDHGRKERAVLCDHDPKVKSPAVAVREQVFFICMLVVKRCRAMAGAAFDASPVPGGRESSCVQRHTTGDPANLRTAASCIIKQLHVADAGIDATLGASVFRASQMDPPAPMQESSRWEHCQVHRSAEEAPHMAPKDAMRRAAADGPLPPPLLPLLPLPATSTN